MARFLHVFALWQGVARASSAAAVDVDTASRGTPFSAANLTGVCIDTCALKRDAYRAFAFCGRDAGVVVLLVSHGTAPAAVAVALGGAAPSGARVDYVLAPDGAPGGGAPIDGLAAPGVRLNGRRLAVSPAGDLPDLGGAPARDASAPIALAPLTLSFHHYPGARARACARSS